MGTTRNSSRRNISSPIRALGAAEAAFKYSWGRDLPIDSSKAVATAYKIASNPASEPGSGGGAPSDLEGIAEDPHPPGAAEAGHISAEFGRPLHSELSLATPLCQHWC